VSNTVKEKNKQNNIKGVVGRPFILKKRKMIKKDRSRLISRAAASESKWFTSEG